MIKWTKVSIGYPSIDNTDLYNKDMCLSERVIVLVEDLDKTLVPTFAQFRHGCDKWLIEGFRGGWKVVAWSSINIV